MRTSGRSGTDSLLFIAPAALFGVFFLWLWGGDVGQLVKWLDGAIVHVGSVLWTWCAALVRAASQG